MNTRLSVTTLAAAAFTSTAAATTSTTIDWSNILHNSAPQASRDLISHLNTGGAYASKTVHGSPGVGIAGGSVHAEIDNDEAITFFFAEPVNVTSLSIAHLYTSGNFGDNVDEAARVTAFSGDLASEFFLTATEATTGSWTGAGILTNDSIATSRGGGAWTVSGSSIFDRPVSSITLGSANPGSASKGDFSFVSLSVTPVPAPGAAAIGALAGAYTLRRRRPAH